MLIIIDLVLNYIYHLLNLQPHITVTTHDTTEMKLIYIRHTYHITYHTENIIVEMTKNVL